MKQNNVKGPPYVAWNALPNLEEMVGHDPLRMLPDDFEGTPRQWANYMGLPVETVCAEFGYSVEAIADSTVWNITRGPTEEHMAAKAARKKRGRK